MSEFVILTSDVPAGDGGTVEYRSTDGIEWTASSTGLPGDRTAAASFEGGAVAVGQAGPRLGAEPDGPAAPETVDGLVYAPPSAVVSVWTLGLPPPPADA